MLIQDHETMVPVEPPKVLYRQLILRDFTPKQAANLVAHLEGLDISLNSWTIQEIEKILFIQESVKRGLIKT